MVWANDYYYRLIGYPKDEYEEKFHNTPPPQFTMPSTVTLRSWARYRSGPSGPSRRVSRDTAWLPECPSKGAGMRGCGWQPPFPKRLSMENRFPTRCLPTLTILCGWKRTSRSLPSEWGAGAAFTVRKIRERLGPEPPILIVSAYDWAEIEKSARQAGANIFAPPLISFQRGTAALKFSCFKTAAYNLFHSCKATVV